MSNQKMLPLAPGYSISFNSPDEAVWQELLLQFRDATVFQTWQYAESFDGQYRMDRVVLTRDGLVVAIAQVRLRTLPLLPIGVAYAHKAPLWMRWDSEPDPEVFGQMVRALHNEYVCRRGLILRVFPVIYSDDLPVLRSHLEELGFCPVPGETPQLTILMDLRSSLEEIYERTQPHWKRSLKTADKKQLEIVECVDEESFDRFLTIYHEMHDRKGFIENVNPADYKILQRTLPDAFKLRILLCYEQETLCAGVIYTVVGDTAIFLFGATSSQGRRSCGSYKLQWQVVKTLKERHIEIYNLNGINQMTNPGTYKFKSDLAGSSGREVRYLGRYESKPEGIIPFLAEFAERNVKKIQQWKKRFASRR